MIESLLSRDLSELARAARNGARVGICVRWQQDACLISGVAAPVLSQRSLQPFRTDAPIPHGAIVTIAQE